MDIQKTIMIYDNENSERLDVREVQSDDGKYRGVEISAAHFGIWTLDDLNELMWFLSSIEAEFKLTGPGLKHADSG
jgi:hypothetical protein